MSPRSTKSPVVEPPRLEVVLAFTLGCIALAAVLWLSFRGEALNEQQFEIVRIVLALAGGGVGAMIPGFLDVGVKASTKLALRASGALAVLVVLYFWSPAHWQPGAGGISASHGSIAVGGSVKNSTLNAKSTAGDETEPKGK
jgi:hypothetical protein